MRRFDLDDTTAMTGIPVPEAGSQRAHDEADDLMHQIEAATTVLKSLAGMPEEPPPPPAPTALKTSETPDELYEPPEIPNPGPWRTPWPVFEPAHVAEVSEIAQPDLQPVLAEPSVEILPPVVAPVDIAPPPPPPEEPTPPAAIAEPAPIPAEARLVEPEARQEQRQDGFAEPSRPSVTLPPTIDLDRGPIRISDEDPDEGGPVGPKGPNGGGGGGNGNGSGNFHRRMQPVSFAQAYQNAVTTVRRNLTLVLFFTVFINILVLAIPIYLFQMSDRVLTSRSTDTLVMLTLFVMGAVVIQVLLDATRRFILMRTAVEAEVQLGAPVLSAAARASLGSNGREYQTLGDLQQIRSFLTSGTLLAFLDAPMAPLFVGVVYIIHPQLGLIIITSSLVLLVIAVINQRVTAKPFGEANGYLSRANSHLESMSRNSQIINALAMIPEAVRIWGKDTAGSLKSQVHAQDLNIMFAGMSKVTRLTTQVAVLGWGAYLSLAGSLTGGMVIAASIIAGRALAPIEGAIEGWNHVIQARSAMGRIKTLLQSSPLNFARLQLPNPQGRLDVERILFVPPPNKRVILNGISFSLQPGESMAVIGNSGAGKTTLGKMLVGSILPTSGNVRLDLMDLRNWDQRQFGENIGYLPQDVQLFPGSIKANIGRMRDDVSDASIYEAAILADVHELISTLPQGYETFVAADGSPLSGGQKQRVALARAFFGNPKMVVLDEPNSNLDTQGEMALANALKSAKSRNITVVTITQRPSLLNCVDKIMVLNNGSVTLFGTRNEVMRNLARQRKGSSDIAPPPAANEDNGGDNE
jgi:ATP-binding cassette subfamily C protein